MFAAALRGAVRKDNLDEDSVGVVQRKRRYRPQIKVRLYIGAAVTWRNIAVLIAGGVVVCGGVMLCVVGFNYHHYSSTGGDVRRVKVNNTPQVNSTLGAGAEAVSTERVNHDMTFIGAILIGTGIFMVIVVVVVVLESRDVILKKLIERERRRRMNRPDLYDLIIERMRRNHELELKTNDDVIIPLTPVRKESFFEMLTRRLSIRSNKSVSSTGTIAQALRRLPVDLFTDAMGSRRAVTVNDTSSRSHDGRRHSHRVELSRASSLPAHRQAADMSPATSLPASPRRPARSATLDEQLMAERGYTSKCSLSPTPLTPLSHRRTPSIREDVSPVSFKSSSLQLNVEKSDSEPVSPMPDVTKSAWSERMEPPEIRLSPETPTPEESDGEREATQPTVNATIHVEPHCQPLEPETDQVETSKTGARTLKTVQHGHQSRLTKQAGVDVADDEAETPAVPADPAVTSSPRDAADYVHVWPDGYV